MAVAPLSAGAVLPTLPGGAQQVATIQFGHGSARLSSRDLRVLRDVARLYRQRGGTVHVTGHSSSRTRNLDAAQHQRVNLRMSEKRANAIAHALEGMGVPADDISVDARSDREPLYYEVMPSGEAGNRRAEIFLTG